MLSLNLLWNLLNKLWYDYRKECRKALRNLKYRGLETAPTKVRNAEVKIQSLKPKIDELRRRKNAVILAHNYQPLEIQEIADYVGDSLDLSRKASKTSADVIVFCGVRFMAETASVLCPERTVLLPDLDAGCPLADTITDEELRRKKKEYPKALVVCYVNSPVEVKAESDICCTSANAVKVVNSLKASEVLFVPDENLGNFAASKTEKNLILWHGSCPAHVELGAEDILRLKAKHPQAVVIVHPECREEVIKAADEVLSTGGMVRYCRETETNEIIVGTEKGILNRLKKENLEKVFYLASEKLLCPDMKLITLEKIVESLSEMKYKISIPDEVRIKAKRSIEKMLTI